MKRVLTQPGSACGLDPTSTTPHPSPFPHPYPLTVFPITNTQDPHTRNDLLDYLPTDRFCLNCQQYKKIRCSPTHVTFDRQIISANAEVETKRQI